MLRNRVMSMASPGMAPANSLHPQPDSFDDTIFLDGLNGILTAGWSIPARIGQQGRDHRLIYLNEQEEWKLNELSQVHG